MRGDGPALQDTTAVPAYTGVYSVTMCGMLYQQGRLGCLEREQTQNVQAALCCAAQVQAPQVVIYTCRGWQHVANAQVVDVCALAV